MNDIASVVTKLKKDLGGANVKLKGVVNKVDFGNNIYVVTDSHGVQYNVYIKISNSTPGFWGLTKTRIDKLQKDALDYYVVLVGLTSRTVLISYESDKLLSGKTPVADGDYKINETDVSLNIALSQSGI